jgi:pilus assembly protein CpaE
MDGMDIKTKILIIDLDAESSRGFKDLFKDVPDTEVAFENENFKRGLEKIEETGASIVILNLSPFEDQALRIAKSITQRFPEVVLFVTSKQTESNQIIRAMRAGAREFLVQPVNKDELMLAVRGTAQKQTSDGDPIDSESKILAFFGAKGGVGTTTVATNVATSLAKHTEKDTVLIDLNLQFGNAALFLNVKQKYSIMDVWKNLGYIDVSVFKAMLHKSSSGVHCLSGPPRVEEAETIKAEHIEELLVMLKKAFNYIIIDLGPALDEVALKALDESDYILIVSALDVPTIYNTKRCLDVCRRIGYDRQKVRLVINRYQGMDDLDSGSIEKLFGYPVFWRLPNQDDKSIAVSMNEGIPISELKPQAKLSQNLLKMIRSFNGSISSEEIAMDKTVKVPLLQKILK